MTEGEFADRMLELSSELDRLVLRDEKLADRIPNNAVIVFQVNGDEAFNRHARDLAKRSRQPNQPVVVVSVSGLAPPLTSRLIDPKIEVASTL